MCDQRPPGSKMRKARPGYGLDRRPNQTTLWSRKLDADRRPGIRPRQIRAGELCLQRPCRGSSNFAVADLHFSPSSKAPQATLCHFGNSTMRHYSAFQLDLTGHVAGRIDLNCIDDEDAKRQAEMLVDTFGLELWEEDRMVAVFTKKELN
jgi:hypothetical protein